MHARRGLVARHPEQPRSPMNEVLQRPERAQPAAKGAASPEEQGDQREDDDQHQRRDAEKRAPVLGRRRAPYGIDDFLQAGLHAEPAAQPDQRGGEQSPADDAVQPRATGQRVGEDDGRDHGADQQDHRQYAQAGRVPDALPGRTPRVDEALPVRHLHRGQRRGIQDQVGADDPVGHERLADPEDIAGQPVDHQAARHPQEHEGEDDRHEHHDLLLHRLGLNELESFGNSTGTFAV